MKSMHYINHDDDPNIPVGMACIYIADNGWLGTNNGYAGQPALFPEAQAEAVCYAWNFFKLDNLPNPGAVKPATLEWLE